MKTITDFDARLLDCLSSLDLSEMRVRVFPADQSGYKYFGEVISPSFETLYEGARQAIVWGKILEMLDDDDQERIEFVMTDTPAERPDRPL